MEQLEIKRALLSVTDKSGLTDMASLLARNGVELVSTGGTYNALKEAGFAVSQVSEVTGFPEILGGRVKTLHPHIHGGILADKDNPEHLATLAERGIKSFDLVCVNLYNFSGALAKKLDERATIEEIDIGGPCLLRASAKNFHSILVVPGVEFYPEVISELETNSMRATLALRRRLASAAFTATSGYDAMISGWLAGR